MMSQARAQYAANPSLASATRASAVAALPKPRLPIPQELDVSERLDRAISKCSQLLDQARAQLAAPVSDLLPSKLTPMRLPTREQRRTP